MKFHLVLLPQRFNGGPVATCQGCVFDGCGWTVQNKAVGATEVYDMTKSLNPKIIARKNKRVLVFSYIHAAY